jgi:hypothetical protein
VVAIPWRLEVTYRSEGIRPRSARAGERNRLMMIESWEWETARNPTGTRSEPVRNPRPRSRAGQPWPPLDASLAGTGVLSVNMTTCTRALESAPSVTASTGEFSGSLWRGRSEPPGGLPGAFRRDRPARRAAEPDFRLRHELSHAMGPSRWLRSPGPLESQHRRRRERVAGFQRPSEPETVRVRRAAPVKIIPEPPPERRFGPVD